MSSNYHALCLSHAPALDATDRHATPERALAEAHRAHPRCELLLCRWSGGLVEVGCPPHSYHPHDTKWADVTWLRMAAAVVWPELDPVPPAVADAIKQLDPCWRPERLRKVRHLLLDEPTCPGGC